MIFLVLSPRMRGWSWGVTIYYHGMLVIPANAGVILKSYPLASASAGYPRECGGDPIFPLFCRSQIRLSPRMRGWSWEFTHYEWFFEVIPANAGVILDRIRITIKQVCYPRECGGDPGLVWLFAYHLRLSPRMRGWSCHGFGTGV